MASFTIKFSTDNAAFEDAAQQEIAATLRQIARDIEHSGEFGSPRRPVFDANGNKIGFYEHVPD